MENITNSQAKIQELICANKQFKMQNKQFKTQNRQFKTQNIKLNKEKKKLQDKNDKIENELITVYEKLNKIETLLEYHKEQQRLELMRRFDSKSEKINPNQLYFLDDVINEAEATGNDNIEETEFEEVPAHKRKKRRTNDEMYKDLDINEIHYAIPQKEQVCDLCKSELHEISTFKRDELKILPVQVIINRHIG